MKPLPDCAWGHLRGIENASARFMSNRTADFGWVNAGRDDTTSNQRMHVQFESFHTWDLAMVFLRRAIRRSKDNHVCMECPLTRYGVFGTKPLFMSREPLVMGVASSLPLVSAVLDNVHN